MTCPQCQAQLLPVDGEMFCLQCGHATGVVAGEDLTGPALEDTAEPLLRRAILEVAQRPVQWRSSTVSIQPNAPPLSVARSRWRWWHGIVLGLALFALLNAVLYGYYRDHIVPGVRLGAVNLSNVPYSELRARVHLAAPAGTIRVNIGPSIYQVRRPNVVDEIAATNLARRQGHGTLLPLVGVLRSWLSSPLAVPYQTSEAVALSEAKLLADEVHHASANGVPLIVADKAFVVEDKSGYQLDMRKTEAALIDAGDKASINLAAERLDPLIAATAYRSDVAQAEARMSLSLQLTVRSQVYRPSSSEIGSWLVFGAPGSGVAVDPAAVANYVRSLPGSFNRVAAVNGLVSAVQSTQSLNMKVSTKAVPAPKPPALVRGVAATYTYCLAPASEASRDAFRSQVGAVLSDSKGWALGERLGFREVSTGCNLTIALADASQMRRMDQRCGVQSTCRVGSWLGFNVAAWGRAPSNWTGDIVSYRKELINHELGHWLGFQHGSCFHPDSSPMPILEGPAVTVAGCSPNWYELPVGQRDKILPGF